MAAARLMHDSTGPNNKLTLLLTQSSQRAHKMAISMKKPIDEFGFSGIILSVTAPYALPLFTQWAWQIAFGLLRIRSAQTGSERP
jgi:hypothetical protein